MLLRNLPERIQIGLTHGLVALRCRLPLSDRLKDRRQEADHRRVLLCGDRIVRLGQDVTERAGAHTGVDGLDGCEAAEGEDIAALGRDDHLHDAGRRLLTEELGDPIGRLELGRLGGKRLVRVLFGLEVSAQPAEDHRYRNGQDDDHDRCAAHCTSQ